MSEIKLKPCPFCGGEAVLFVDNGVRVICTECSASSKILKDRITIKGVSGGATESVIGAWNKRFANTTLVHAHWKGYHTQEPYCSNCGFSYDHEQGEDAQTTDYCGNCGAKMDENEVENLERCSCGDRQYCPEVEKDENGKWFIRCYRCRKNVWGNTIEEAVNAWNGSQNCGIETDGGDTDA